MLTRLTTPILITALTLLNVYFFFQRWGESPWYWLQAIVPYVQISSVLSGIVVGIFTVCFIQQLRERRWFSLVPLIVGATTVGALMTHTIAYGKLATPSQTSFIVGIILGVLGYNWKDAPAPKKPKHLARSVALFFAASLNFYLLTAPGSTHLPSILQDSPEGTNLQRFYYASIHSDSAPVYRWMRGAINFFLPAPSINGTALCSMITASLGIALTAGAVQMAGGALWAWIFLLLAWFDQWGFALAVNPGTIAMSIITVATMLFTVTWALVRDNSPLKRRESILIGLAMMLLSIFSLYSYSAARFAWATGSAILGAVLISRGILRPNLAGARSVALMAAPSVIFIASIWALIFHGDTDRFKAQLFIGPLASNFISDRATDTRKYIEVHDNDMPIWLGTGRLVDANATVYWKRSIGEVAEKAFSLLSKLSEAPPLKIEIPTIAFIAVFVGLASRQWERRAIAGVWGLFAIIAFSPYIIAQDLSAYRRACSANIIFAALATLLFAFRSRTGAGVILSALPLLGVAIAKAPIELAPLAGYGFIDPPCVVCQGQINLKPLINDPEFKKIVGRNLHFVVYQDHGTISYKRCISEAFSSWEWKSLAPRTNVLAPSAGPFRASLEPLPAGDIIIVSCPRLRPATAELSDICEGKNDLVKTLAVVEQIPIERNAFWVFAERLEHRDGTRSTGAR